VGQTLLLVAIAYGAVAQGAFFAYQFRVLLVLVAAGAVATALGSSRPRLRPLVPWLVAMSALAASILLSALVSGNPKGALPGLALVALLMCAALIASGADPRQRDLIVYAAVAVGVLVGLSGWIGVVLRSTPLAIEDTALWRAASTLTYANATAGFLLLPVHLALARSVLRPGERLWRSASYLLLVGIAATLSRAGFVALLAGGVILVFMLGRRRALAALWPIGAGALIALVGLVPNLVASARSQPAAAVIALLVGGVVALVRPSPKVAAAGVAAVVMVALLVPGAVTRAGKELLRIRLTPASAHVRQETWGATFRLVQKHPVLGVGAQDMVVFYRSRTAGPVGSKFAHNEFLQLTAEQGILGLVLLTVVLAVAARSLARSRSKTPDWMWAGAVAGFAAFLAHSAGDFLWHVPVIPLCAVTVLAAITGCNDEGSTSP
jgi:hypothetical protein